MINNSDNPSSPLNCLNYTHIHTFSKKRTAAHNVHCSFYITLFFLFQEVKQ